MRTSTIPTPGTALRLAALAALLAACTTTPTTPTGSPPPAGALAARGDIHPCLNRDPAREASDTQGVSAEYPDNPYTGKDAYTNVVVREGTILYSLTPGAPPRFAVMEGTLRDAAGSWQKYYDLVQVTTDPGKDENGTPRKLREQVQAFHVTEPLCAAHGIASANGHFGKGGGTQYYVSTRDTYKLRPGKIEHIARWSPPAGTGQ